MAEKEKKKEEKNIEIEIPKKEAEQWARQGGIGNCSGGNGNSHPPKK